VFEKMFYERNEKKQLKFGTITVNLESHDEVKLPASEAVLALLTDIFGHPIIIDAPFFIQMDCYKKFMIMSLLIFELDGTKLGNYKNKKFYSAMEMIHIGESNLLKNDWFNIYKASDKREVRYMFIHTV
jgi:hypothetical protein